MRGALLCATHHRGLGFSDPNWPGGDRRAEDTSPALLPMQVTVSRWETETRLVIARRHSTLGSGDTVLNRARVRCSARLGVCGAARCPREVPFF
jgi:hypothetical protein